MQRCTTRLQEQSTFGDIHSLGPAPSTVLEIENGQTELDEERTDEIEVDGSVNELDGEGEEKKEEDEGSDDHNWK